MSTEIKKPGPESHTCSLDPTRLSTRIGVRRSNLRTLQFYWLDFLTTSILCLLLLLHLLRHHRLRLLLSFHSFLFPKKKKGKTKLAPDLNSMYIAHLDAILC